MNHTGDPKKEGVSIGRLLFPLHWVQTNQDINLWLDLRGLNFTGKPVKFLEDAAMGS